MRLPKRGFKSPNRVEYVAINLGRINEIVAKYNISEISPEGLYKLGIIKKNDLVKILGTGELTSKVKVVAHACSATAADKIQAQGGTVETL